MDRREAIIILGILKYIILLIILIWAWGEVLGIFGYETNFWQRLALALLSIIIPRLLRDRGD